MDTKFNEQQAFDDLQAILGHIHDLANKFYTELQTAQALNREKDEQLNNLQKSLNDEIARHRNDINALTKNLTEQKESFTRALQETRKDNLKLSQQLKLLEDEWTSKKNRLDEREKTFAEQEKELSQDRETLKTEREEFDRYKSSIQTKLDSYEELRKQAQNFDNDKQKIHEDYRQEVEKLKKQNQEAQTRIQQLEEEKSDLQGTVNNYLRQIKDLNDKISESKNASGDGQNFSPQQEQGY